jgi:hypothetical protein
MVDVAIELKKAEAKDENSVSQLRLQALRVAELAPPCAICESLYSNILVDIFGIDDKYIQGLSGSTEPSEETLFAIGRAAYMGLKIDLSGYLNYCLRETCVALYDVDIVRAADGVLALAGIESGNREAFPPMAKRFLTQALASLDLLLDLYVDAASRIVMQNAVTLCRI